MARPAKSVQDQSLLQAALEGLEMQRQRIEEQISQVRSLLGGRTPRSTTASASASAPAPAKSSGKRQLSAAARKRIAEAQKRRWAEYRKKSPAKGKE